MVKGSEFTEFLAGELQRLNKGQRFSGVEFSLLREGPLCICVEAWAGASRSEAVSETRMVSFPDLRTFDNGADALLTLLVQSAIDDVRMAIDLGANPPGKADESFSMSQGRKPTLGQALPTDAKLSEGLIAAKFSISSSADNVDVNPDTGVVRAWPSAEAKAEERRLFSNEGWERERRTWTADSSDGDKIERAIRSMDADVTEEMTWKHGPGFIVPSIEMVDTRLRDAVIAIFAARYSAGYVPVSLGQQIAGEAIQLAKILIEEMDKEAGR